MFHLPNLFIWYNSGFEFRLWQFQEVLQHQQAKQDGRGDQFDQKGNHLQSQMFYLLRANI